MIDDYISASEISDYIYCQRAWWYRLRGFISTQQAALREGIVQHQVIAQTVEQVESTSRYGRQLIVLGLVLLIIVVLLRLLVK